MTARLVSASSATVSAVEVLSVAQQGWQRVARAEHR